MKPSRRDIMCYGAAGWTAARARIYGEESTEVNDIHSQLNPTRVARVVRPRSLDQLRQSEIPVPAWLARLPVASILISGGGPT